MKDGAGDRKELAYLPSHALPTIRPGIGECRALPALSGYEK